MADLSELQSSESVKVAGATSVGSETNYLAVDINQNLGAVLKDGSGVSIDSLNSGTGLNALNFAMTATNYILSTANSTTSQLASGTTFTGTIETVFNQQAISAILTSDQNGTLIFNQYIDAAGTRKCSALSYTITANVPFSRCLQANGNYFNLTFKNTGSSTTTTLNINVAYGTLPSVTALGNGQVSIDEINGIASSARPDGFMRVVLDPTSILFDTFETLDTTNTWTIGGTTVPSGTAGALSVAPGTAANATSYAKSIASFIPGASAYLQFATLVQIEATPISGNQRFWGLGVYSTPTLTVPISNGVVFEVDSVAGNLLCSVYSNSVRTQSATLVRPIDGGTHRYAIYYKASRVYYEIDNVIVGTFPFPNPQVSSLSTVIGSVNAGSVLATAALLNATLIGVGDTGRNSTKLSDGKYAWRNATISSLGELLVNAVPLDGSKATYSAGVSGLVTTATATDVFVISGSATKTIRITNISFSMTTTSGSGGAINLSLIKRSSANSGGTFASSTVVPHDSANASATATVVSYTANPTSLGTTVGVVRSSRYAVVGQNTAFITTWGFGTRPGQAVVLRGVSQSLALNFNSGSFTGAVADVDVEFTEE